MSNVKVQVLVPKNEVMFYYMRAGSKVSDILGIRRVRKALARSRRGWDYVNIVLNGTSLSDNSISTYSLVDGDTLLIIPYILSES